MRQNDWQLVKDIESETYRAFMGSEKELCRIIREIEADHYFCEQKCQKLQKAIDQKLRDDFDLRGE